MAKFFGIKRSVKIRKMRKLGQPTLVLVNSKMGHSSGSHNQRQHIVEPFAGTKCSFFKQSDSNRKLNHVKSLFQ